MSLRLFASLETMRAAITRPEDFKPDDLFTQIQNLAENLAAERCARHAAEAADKAKSELLATAGQELKAPVEKLIAMTELLSASPLDPAQRRYTDMLAEAAWSLLGVLNHLLDYTRLEIWRCELHPAAFDLHEMLQEMGSVLHDRASEKGLVSGVDIGASCPRQVVADDTRVRQVLMTLIDNALTSTTEGSVRLHASAIEVNGLWMLRFDVSDTGRGYSRAEREQLFNSVVRVPSAMQAGAGGSGLDLSIVRKLAALMGGEVGCDSVVGKGSLYWFTLAAEHADSQPARGAYEPLAEMPASEPHPAISVQVPEQEPIAKLSGHALVVEDNAVNRMLIAAYLEEFGLRYEMVSSGATALLSLAAKRYDLVLLDVTMPDLDGIEATKRIRALHAPAGKVPIVALVSTKTGDRASYLAAGMDAYVSKPIRGRELYRVIARFLPGETGDEPALLAG